MKILIIGCGGIGSFLVENINRAYEGDQLSPEIELHIADPDTVELKNVKYQNFKKEEILKNKAKCLKGRYDFVAKAITKKITISQEDSAYKGYDLFILAVDNFITRKEVIEYCYQNNKHFIDLRAEGRTVFCMSKGEDLTEDLGTLDMKDKEWGSCQREDDFKRGVIQYGNIVAAAIGIQMILNYLRLDQKNKRILITI